MIAPVPYLRPASDWRRSGAPCIRNLAAENALLRAGGWQRQENLPERSERTIFGLDPAKSAAKPVRDREDGRTQVAAASRRILDGVEMAREVADIRIDVSLLLETDTLQDLLSFPLLPFSPRLKRGIFN